MCDRFGLVLQLVSQALGQDDRNEYEDAYVNYLKSLEAVAASLLKDYSAHGMPDTPLPVNSAKKVIAIVRQCLDRMEKILGASLNQFYAEQEKCNETYLCPPAILELQPPCRPEALGHASLPPVAFVAPRMLSRQPPQQARPANPPSGTALMSNPMFTEGGGMPGSAASASETRRKLTPMEEMERQNAVVCQRYQALIKRTRDPAAKQNLRFELQRRLMDNLIAGRKKQAEYLQELQEQEKQIAEMAARKLQSSGECTTPEEKRQQELFTRILQYENKRGLQTSAQPVASQGTRGPATRDGRVPGRPGRAAGSSRGASRQRQQPPISGLCPCGKRSPDRAPPAGADPGAPEEPRSPGGLLQCAGGPLHLATVAPPSGSCQAGKPCRGAACGGRHEPAGLGVGARDARVPVPVREPNTGRGSGDAAHRAQAGPQPQAACPGARHKAGVHRTFYK
ncbi:VPS9 domain-containing protein 1-like isoform X6 [Haemaphysalis longicornis]